MQGSDDKGIDNRGTDAELHENYKYTGGFAQLDYAGLMNNRLVGSLVFNWISPPKSDEERKTNAFSVLLRYYLGDWTAVNVALNAEYTHREIGKTDKARNDQLGLLLDFAF